MDDSVLAYLVRQWEVHGDAQKQSYAKLPLRIKRRVVAPYDLGVLFRTGTPMYRRKAREMIARSGLYKLHNKTLMILKREHLSTTEWMDEEYENKGNVSSFTVGVKLLPPAIFHVQQILLKPREGG